MNAEQASASLERRYTALSEEHSKARSLPPSQRRDAFPPSEKDEAAFTFVDYERI